MVSNPIVIRIHIRVPKSIKEIIKNYFWGFWLKLKTTFIFYNFKLTKIFLCIFKKCFNLLEKHIYKIFDELDNAFSNAYATFCL